MLENTANQLKLTSKHCHSNIIVPDDRKNDVDAYLTELEEKNGWEKNNGGLGYIIMPKGDPPWPPPNKA